MVAIRQFLLNHKNALRVRCGLSSRISVALGGGALAIVLLLGGSGCSQAPRRGGKAAMPFSGHIMPGNKVAAPAQVASMEIEQPENPAQPASQSREATNEIAFTIPTGSTVRQTTQSVTPEKTNTTTMEFVVAQPMPYRQISGERNAQVIGAAQKDTSRELSAKFAAIRPVQWVGVICLLGACALAYFGWWTKAAIVGVTGIGMIIVASVIPGNELVILSVGGVVVAVGCLVVMYAYNKGLLDKYLPDALDRNPPPTQEK